MSGAWNPEKVAVFADTFRDFLRYVKISSKETGGGTVLGDCVYNAQEMFLNAVFGALSKDIHDIYVLKSRQLGVSTISRALSLFWLGVHEGLRGAMVFDTAFNTSLARIEIEQILKDLPASLKFPRIKSYNRDGIVLDNNSILLFMQAGVRNARAAGGLGRSAGLNFVHACMAPGTPVVVQHGGIKPIEDVTPDDWVVTHNGHPARVIANVGQPNPNGTMLKIAPWLGQPVYCTEDHKIPTDRGLVKAGDLSIKDRLLMPIRPISHKISRIQLPHTPPRRQQGGKQSVGAGETIELSEEFGFFAGYYLAEGHIHTQTSGRPSAIIFTRHRDEKEFADRAIAAVSHVSSGRRTKDRRGALASADHIYGAALAAWMNEHFGRVGKKRIPDEVFDWGRDFCRGMVAGIIAGDGSKTPSVVNRNPRERKLDPNRKRQRNPRACRTERNEGMVVDRVNLITIHSSIAMQTRDLVASLGLGWGSLRKRDGGIRYGRNCRDAYVLDWNGAAAANLRSLIGLGVQANKKPSVQKYEIVDDHVLIKIRSIEDGIEAPFMYDLSVDHDDHTFRTPFFAVSNSEVCSWGNEEGLVSFRQSLAEANPNRLYVWESTARGYNSWYRLWQEAKVDNNNKETLFIGWWAKETQIIERGLPDFEKYGRDDPTEREAERIELVRKLYGWEVSREQLAWYRRKIDPARELTEDDPEDSNLVQEQPWIEEDAFQQTGSTFFQAEKITEATVYAAKAPRPTLYKFWPGVDFLTSDMKLAERRREVEFKMWEEPVENSWYVISADPAYGHDEKNNNSAVQVMRCFADGLDQVGEYASASIQPHQFSWLLWTLVGYYGSLPNNQVLMICEINGPGEEVWRQYRQTQASLQTYQRAAAREKGIGNIVGNARSYIYSRSDSMNAGHNFQWKTNEQLKVQIMEACRNYFHNGVLRVVSFETFEEMRTITRDGDSIGAEGANRDDRTFALAMAVRAWDEKIRRQLMGNNRTREFERARTSLTIADQWALFRKYTFEEMQRRKQRERGQASIVAHRNAWRTGAPRHHQWPARRP